MCLVVHRDTQKKIAEEDIIVYKELRHIYENVVSACYQDFNYTLEKLYKTEITKETPNEVIHICFDCEDSEVLMKTYGDSWRINENLVSYAQGFHSALAQDRFKELAYYNSSILNAASFHRYPQRPGLRTRIKRHPHHHPPQKDIRKDRSVHYATGGVQMQRSLSYLRLREGSERFEC